MKSNSSRSVKLKFDTETNPHDLKTYTEIADRRFPLQFPFRVVNVDRIFFSARIVSILFTRVEELVDASLVEAKWNVEEKNK